MAIRTIGLKSSLHFLPLSLGQIEGFLIGNNAALHVFHEDNALGDTQPLDSRDVSSGRVLYFSRMDQRFFFQPDDFLGRGISSLFLLSVGVVVR